MKKYFGKKNFKAYVPKLIIYISISVLFAFILYFINFTTIYMPYTNIENIEQLNSIGQSINPLNKYVKIKSELLTLTDIQVANRKNNTYDKYVYTYELEGNLIPIIVTKETEENFTDDIANYIISGKVQSTSNNNIILGEQYYEYLINERTNDRLYFQIAVGLLFIPILFSLIGILKYSKYFIKKKNPMYKYLLTYTKAADIPAIVNDEILNKSIYSVDGEIIITEKLLALDGKSPSIIYLDDVVSCALTDKGYKNPYGSVLHFYLRNGNFVKSNPINNTVSIHARQLLSQRCPWIVIDTKKKISKLVKKDFNGLLEQVDSFKKESIHEPTGGILEKSDLVFTSDKKIEPDFGELDSKPESEILQDSINKIEEDVHESLIINSTDIDEDVIIVPSTDDFHEDYDEDLDESFDIDEDLDDVNIKR